MEMGHFSCLKSYDIT